MTTIINVNLDITKGLIKHVENITGRTPNVINTDPLTTQLVFDPDLTSGQKQALTNGLPSWFRVLLNIEVV